VDSATLMNKGLELIEACWLFGVTPDDVQVIVHPQSVVHSMVEYVDGSVLAQLGNPDMRTPISHALAWPQRWESGVESLDIVGLGRLTFEEPDLERFPCLRLAQQAARSGGTLPAILNAANEAAVESFLDGHLNFTSIPVVIEGVLNCVAAAPVRNLDSVLAADRAARQAAAKLISRLEGATPDSVAGALA
ncbi:MAG TPA: 1-deoxy-D-xylulose-5-phosphate reductoisomerase, partial [Steroidobacteraceae bacterium]|nr:1-deoxy-D-xylulose-5-phosphate reductoisomerase [Steroidobacteraceae bacterium]